MRVDVRKILIMASIVTSSSGSVWATPTEFDTYTFYKELIVSKSYPSAQIVREFTNDPLSGSITHIAAPGMTALSSVDFGVLKASASVPTLASGDTSYSALAATGYGDTMTFTRHGSDWIPVTFSYILDGSVLDNAENGRVDLKMSMTGVENSVRAITGVGSYAWGMPIMYKDDALYNYGMSAADFEALFEPDPACRNTSFSENPYGCHLSYAYTYTTSGEKTITANFNFEVLNGHTFDVWSVLSVSARASTDSPGAATWDFSHTALLEGIYAPDGTTITSAFPDSFVINGGVGNYREAIAESGLTASVSEPTSIALLGLGLLGMAITRKRKQILLSSAA